MKRISRKMKMGGEIEDYVFSITQDDAAKIERPLGKKKIQIFWIIIIVSISALAARTFYLNGIKGKYYQEIAKGNSIQSIIIKAPRGKIFDRSGRNVLVNNVPSLDAVFISAYLPKSSEQRQEISEKLSKIFQINQGEILAKFNSEGVSFNPVLLKENISQDESLVFLEKSQEFPGIALEKTAIRQYPDGSIFSHILGYEGKIEKKEYEENTNYLLTDYIGKQGIEKTYEKYLKGVNGADQVEVDSRGNIKKQRGIINPKPGSDLILNIDAELQKKMHESLNSMLETSGTKTAAAVAIDPKDGGVLGLVSLPSYDNNLFSSQISQADYLNLINNTDKPLFNRAISGEYPPGSTIKPLISIAGLSEGVINESTVVNCPGVINIGSYHFGDWKTHGAVNVRDAIAESCDVFYYSVGGGYGNIDALGMDRMKIYENNFGLGNKLGIDIPGESSGLIPNAQWKLDKLKERWYTGDDYHASIGQGFITATPLQIANYIAAIANGGTLYQPMIVSQIKKNSGETAAVGPKIIGKNLASQNIIKIVQEGMRQTVTAGTAQTLKTLPVEVAGKTGTAQFGSENKTHSWFVSYAPYNNPTIAMVVLAEGGGEGHSAALPATKEIYEWYFGSR